MDLSFLNPFAQNTDATVQAPVQQNAGNNFGWLDTLRSDPNAKQALFIAGLNMMMQQPGEGALGAVARGGLSGMDFYQRKTVADQEARQNAQKLDLDLRKGEQAMQNTGLDMEAKRMSNEALPTQLQQEEEGRKQENAKRNIEIEKAEKTLQAFVDKANNDAAKAKNDEEASAIDLSAKRRIDNWRKNNPGLEDQAFKAEMLLPGAKLNAENALTTQRKASAGADNARASLTAAQKTGVELENAGLEAIPVGERALKKTNTNPSAMEQNISARMENWKILNPEPADPVQKQAWRKAYAKQNETLRTQAASKKQSDIDSAKIILATPEDFEPALVEQAKAVLASSIMPVQASPAAGGNANAVTKITRDPKTGKIKQEPSAAVQAIPR